MKVQGGGEPDQARLEAQFIDLFNRMCPRLVTDLTRSLGSRASAEECVQQAFEQAWKRWGKDEVLNDEAWITRIAVNVANDRRSYDKLRTIPEILRRFGARHDAAPDPAELGAGSPVWDAVRTLKPADRLIVLWRFQQGLTEAEIAERLGKSKRTVQTHIAKLRETLRSELIRNGEMPRLLAEPAVEGVEL